MWFFSAFCKPHHFGILNELLKELFIITLLYGYILTKNVHELDGASKQKKPKMVFDFKEKAWTTVKIEVYFMC